MESIDFSASGFVPRRSVEMTSNANHGLECAVWCRIWVEGRLVICPPIATE